MATAQDARKAVRALLEVTANHPTDTAGNKIPLSWQNEDRGALPDVAVPFAFIEILTDQGKLLSYGGGTGANRYRVYGTIFGYVFVPRGQGLDQAENIAEQIAALFRSYSDGTINCIDATVREGGDGAALKPPGMSSEVDNYFWSLAQVTFFFDQIG